jgi:hypothetical protein
VDVVAQGSQAARALTNGFEMRDESMARGRCKPLRSNRKTPRPSFDSRLSLSSNETRIIIDVAHSSEE